MFRIRRVFDDVMAADREAMRKVQRILAEQFPGLAPREVEELPRRLRDPVAHGFRAVLLVAESGPGRVRGFALMSHAPDLGFCYLDFISAAPGRTGGGIGGALYQRVREEAVHLAPVGLFFECLPDDPEVCRDGELLAANRARLRFYERFGARPIAGTAYDTPVSAADTCPPLLVFDDLGRGRPLRRAEARDIIRAILERKYAGVCDREYVERVVASIKDDPVRLRPSRYSRARSGPPPVAAEIPEDERIALVINDRHEVHHVHEAGYVESPVRIRSILEGLAASPAFLRVPARHFGRRYLTTVHDEGLVGYLERVTEKLGEGESVYPYVFPIRNRTRPPRELPLRAGYFSIDTFTPISRGAIAAARAAVDCALTAAQEIARGRRLAYALVRPPGHHAERGAFGGFCYYNNVAIAAAYLLQQGRVAILDLDFHHGNGAQEIFYRSRDVLTVSLHGHPSFAYPYFSGFAGERGEGEGEGFNLNLPLPEGTDGERYRRALRRALAAIAEFAPVVLVVALGLDTARRDPTGSFVLGAADFRENGRMVGALRLPTLVVQEGGYRTRTLGVNARAFFEGLWGAHMGRAGGSSSGAPGRR